MFETEPTFALFKTFRDDMTLARVAAEVGVEAEFFKDAINDMPTALKSELTGLQTDGVNINRSTFLLISQDIIAFLEEGGAFAAEAEACGGTGIACLEGQTCLLDESDAQFGACIGEYD